MQSNGSAVVVGRKNPAYKRPRKFQGVFRDSQYFADIVAEALNLPRDQRQGEAWRIVRAFAQAMQNILKNNEVLRVKGFGVFRQSWKPARKNRAVFYRGKSKEPHVEMIELPARLRVTFTPSKVLKEFVNES